MGGPVISPEHSQVGLYTARNQKSGITAAIRSAAGNFDEFIEGFEYTEIANTLHKTEGNIRVIMHRGLKKMREILGRSEV